VRSAPADPILTLHVPPVAHKALAPADSRGQMCGP
jgi:hypothetical protein